MNDDVSISRQLRSIRLVYRDTTKLFWLFQSKDDRMQAATQMSQIKYIGPHARSLNLTRSSPSTMALDRFYIVLKIQWSSVCNATTSHICKAAIAAWTAKQFASVLYSVVCTPLIRGEESKSPHTLTRSSKCLAISDNLTSSWYSGTKHDNHFIRSKTFSGFGVCLAEYNSQHIRRRLCDNYGIVHWVLSPWPSITFSLSTLSRLADHNALMTVMVAEPKWADSQ